MSKYNILYGKVPKTGSEYIRNQLNQYAKDNSLVCNDNGYEGFNLKKKFNITTNHFNITDDNIKHFYDSIDVNLPTLKVASIRKPIDRLYSHFCYSIGCGNFNERYVNFVKNKMSEESLGWYPIDLKRGHKTNNYISKYLGINSIDEIESKYDFFFVQELMDESFLKFGKIIGYDFKKTDITNKTKNKTEILYDDLTIQIFNENNRLDNDIYDYVIKYFNE